MVTRVRALAFPIFQKDWLYFTLQVCTAAETDAAQGASTSLASWSFFRGVQTRIENEWKAIQESKPGSFKNIVLKVADWVLSQEDPTEAFFKSVPTTGKNNTLEVLYPDSYQEVYVRRHLLFTARNREKYHKAWLRVTGICILPLLPLAVTPLPNLPIYYLGYRVYSHRQAWQGAVAVLEHLQHLETYKPTAPDPEAAGLIRSSTNLHASFDSSVTARLLFTPDADLTSIGGSRERGRTPLGDEEAATLAQHYEMETIMAAVVKIRKRALKDSSSSDKFQE